MPRAGGNIEQIARLDLHGTDLAGTPLTELLTHRTVLAALDPGDTRSP